MTLVIFGRRGGVRRLSWRGANIRARDVEHGERPHEQYEYGATSERVACASSHRYACGFQVRAGSGGAPKVLKISD
jgi:hypothetical protein